jgi:RNA polymerase sigma-70 factor (ECF subfamily)
MSHRGEFERLVRDHEAMIGRICASYENDRELARELVQDVLFAIWRALPEYRAESSLKTFIARIAQFRAISHVARHSKLPAHEPIPDDLPAAVVTVIYHVYTKKRMRRFESVRRSLNNEEHNP